MYLWGCKVENKQYCDEVIQCGDPERPFCDLAGTHPASGGVANNCIACAPNAFLGCLGDTASSCNADGSERLSQECQYGCNASIGQCNECEPGASVCEGETVTVCGADGRVALSEVCTMGCHPAGERCWDLYPSNDLAFYLDQAAEAEDLVLSGEAQINTDSGEVRDGDGTVIEVPSIGLNAPPGGVPVRVFIVRSLTAGDVDVSGKPAIAIVAHREIVLRGEFSVSVRDFYEGAGGISEKDACIGRTGGIVDDTNTAGNGGAGGATRGGDGGAVTSNGSVVGFAGPGGNAVDNVDLIPLRGGCAGGSKSGLNPNGGGAVQLVSRRSISLEPGGYITANGGAGAYAVTTILAAEGGGSGGGILLEAPIVEMHAGTGVAANGGSGGCFGMHGLDGQISDSPAPGAACNDFRFRPGGDGAVGGVPPEAGSSLELDMDAGLAGSGGGAVGFVRINTLTGQFVIMVGETLLSPTPSVGELQLR